MKYLLMVVLLFSFSQTSAAGTTQSLYTGNDLLDLCEAYLDDDPINISRGRTCFAYAGGIVDAHDNFVGWGDLKKEWCKPENMAVKQSVRIVTKYLQEHPQDLHKSAASLVTNAFIKAFPCE